MYTQKQRDYYNINRDRTCAELKITKNDFNWFRRVGNELHRIYELNCNGEITEEAYEANTGVLYELADKKAQNLGLFIFYQTDPRGATIYLDTKEIPENNYNSAHCIY